MSAPIFNENGDFQTRLASSVQQDLMTLQASTSDPESTSTTLISDPLIPDKSVTDRLAHMDPDIYDLSDTSHLMKLLKVLLGGAGSGGMRKQISVARLQNSFSGMHFLDLDRFYGALFGIRRTSAEQMPDFGTLGNPAVFDPYTDAAGSDTWDDVHSRDASYRERLVKFAKALPLGATYAGLRAAAEALLSVECEIYESWTWVDEQNQAATQPPIVVYTYNAINQAFPSWSSMEKNHTWSNLTGSGGTSYFLGRTGQKNRGEILIQPKRQIRQDENWGALRVINTLKPAGTQVMLNSDGLAIHTPVQIRAVAADSEYWEIIYKTTPSPVLVDPGPSQPIYIEQDSSKCQPRPAFSQYQGEKWSYNNDISAVSSYEMIANAVLTATNYETVVWRDGHSRDYLTSQAVLDGARALAARVVADGVMTSFAYAGREGAAALSNVSITGGSG